MTHIGSDHRSVMAQSVIKAPRQEDPQKLLPKKTSTKESIRIKGDGRRESEEANVIDERYPELESRVKQDAVTAVENIQAEGSDEARAATAHTEVYVAAAQSLVADANAGTSGSEAHAAAARNLVEEASATAADAEAHAAAADNAAAAKDETKKTNDMLKSRNNKNELSKEDEDKAAAAKKESNSTRDSLRSQDNENEKPEKRDDEIRRLIEEKRCITKGDKQ